MFNKLNANVILISKKCINVNRMGTTKTCVNKSLIKNIKMQQYILLMVIY